MLERLEVQNSINGQWSQGRTEDTQLELRPRPHVWYSRRSPGSERLGCRRSIPLHVDIDCTASSRCQEGCVSMAQCLHTMYTVQPVSSHHELHARCGGLDLVPGGRLKKQRRMAGRQRELCSSRKDSEWGHGWTGESVWLAIFCQR